MNNIPKEIIDFNKDQVNHIFLVQRLVMMFCQNLMNAVMNHDQSKFSENEYEQFVNSRSSLNKSKDGQDKDYQKQWRSKAIQYHITTNKHHPEYWDAIGKKMPLEEIIIMVCDWLSRAIDKGDPINGWNNFLEYNLKKLDKQPHAKIIIQSINIVELIPKELLFPELKVFIIENIEFIAAYSQDDAKTFFLDNYPGESISKVKEVPIDFPVTELAIYDDLANKTNPKSIMETIKLKIYKGEKPPFSLGSTEY